MIDSDKYELMVDMRIYQASTRVFKLSLILWNRMKISGVEHIPDQGGVMIASNHASYLDPAIVGVGYRKRPVHFMARDTLWKPGFGKWWMDHVGCIPVARGKGDIRALKLTIRALREGKVVSMFPEGTRSPDGSLQSAKSGVGMIVEKSACAVVPAYIRGSYKAFPKGSKWIKPTPVSIDFGPPILPDDFKALGQGRDVYDTNAALIMERIARVRDGD